MSTGPSCTVAQAGHCTRQAAPFTETTVGPSIFKTCFSAPLISLRALAARSGVSKVEAETGKGEGELPCFVTGCQALPADPRAQWLKVFIFYFFAFYNIMDGPGGY